jgi:N-acetyl-alpha-D-muramate 1-phosphate uridylyltransferase
MRPLRFPLMLFAAGFGTRMGALTADRPKPLIPVAGTTLLDHALALAEGAGAASPVINLHYRGAQIEAHCQGRDVRFSREAPVILDTGGGLKAALPMLGDSAVMTLNTDAVWTGENPLLQLAGAWDPSRMDALLLLLPLAGVTGHPGSGDFNMAANGRIAWGKGAGGPVYLGAQIVKAERVSAIAEPVFSMTRVWDAAMTEGRAYGLIHQGGWCDVGTPAGIALAEAMIANV